MPPLLHHLSLIQNHNAVCVQNRSPSRCATTRGGPALPSSVTVACCIQASACESMLDVASSRMSNEGSRKYARKKASSWRCPCAEHARRAPSHHSPIPPGSPRKNSSMPIASAADQIRPSRVYPGIRSHCCAHVSENRKDILLHRAPHADEGSSSCQSRKRTPSKRISPFFHQVIVPKQHRCTKVLFPEPVAPTRGPRLTHAGISTVNAAQNGLVWEVGKVDAPEFHMALHGLRHMAPRGLPVGLGMRYQF